jgi:hypothetical protein
MNLLTKSYIWTIGYRDSGEPMISGPFVDEDDAVDGTAHLSNVRFIRLATRDRTKAMPQIREQLRHSKKPQPHTDSPMDTTTRRSIMDRMLHKNKQEDDLEDA